MDKLFAPWRMAYILAADEAQGACIFCQFPSEGPERFRERLILRSTPRAFAIMNRYPYASGHVMVVPRAHVADPALLDGADYAATTELLRAATACVRETLGAHGMNLGMNLGRVAGAGIDQHCHYHIVPRWNGDTNFMPVLADVRVLPEHLVDTYDRLLPAFRALRLPGEPAGE